MDKAQVLTVIHNLNDGDLLNLWGEFCEANRWDNEIVGSLSDMADHLNETPLAFAERCIQGGLNSISYAYHTLDSYGHILGFDSLDDVDCPIDYDELAEWMIRVEHEWLADE